MCCDLKECTTCKENKPLSDFNRDKRTKDGHVNKCRACLKVSRKIYYDSNRETILAYSKQYNKNNRDALLIKGLEYRKANRDTLNAKQKVYAEAHKEEIAAYKKQYCKDNEAYLKEYIRAYIVEDRTKNPAKYRERAIKYRINNRDKTNAKAAKYRYSKLERTPSWSDLEVIKNFYTLAVCCEELFGEAYHVDHIIPLQGELVSGLHTPDNLQVITAKANLSKSNKWEV